MTVNFTYIMTNPSYGKYILRGSIEFFDVFLRRDDDLEVISSRGSPYSTRTLWINGSDTIHIIIAESLYRLGDLPFHKRWRPRPQHKSHS